VAILSRGYRRESRDLVIVSDGREILADCRQGGDEPVMLAKSLPAVPVVVDRDRVRGGRFIEHRFKPDILLLDDGYQHRRLHRDLDIVTFRADKLWGNGFCLPAGPLRERRHHLKRADLIWLNGDTVDSDQQQAAGGCSTAFKPFTTDRTRRPLWRAIACCSARAKSGSLLRYRSARSFSPTIVAPGSNNCHFSHLCRPPSLCTCRAACLARRSPTNRMPMVDHNRKRLA